MDSAHHYIFLAGALGLLSIFAGLLSRRVGAPLLLVFLGLGMPVVQGWTIQPAARLLGFTGKAGAVDAREELSTGSGPA